MCWSWGNGCGHCGGCGGCGNNGWGWNSCGNNGRNSYRRGFNDGYAIGYRDGYDAGIMAAVAAEIRDGDSACMRCELRRRKPGGESCPAFFPSVIKNSKNTLKIGATGFEPATSRPPAERATKLRHTPKINHSCTLPNFQLTYTAIC